MKTNHLKKLSRKALKEVSGGNLVPALECYSNRECSRYGEAFIMCPDGTASMTGYYCMGGQCMLNTGFCNPAEPLEPSDPVLIP